MYGLRRLQRRRRRAPPKSDRVTGSGGRPDRCMFGVRPRCLRWASAAAAGGGGVLNLSRLHACSHSAKSAGARVSAAGQHCSSLAVLVPLVETGLQPSHDDPAHTAALLKWPTVTMALEPGQPYGLPHALLSTSQCWRHLTLDSPPMQRLVSSGDPAANLQQLAQLLLCQRNTLNKAQLGALHAVGPGGGGAGGGATGSAAAARGCGRRLAARAAALQAARWNLDCAMRECVAKRGMPALPCSCAPAGCSPLTAKLLTEVEAGNPRAWVRCACWRGRARQLCLLLWLPTPALGHKPGMAAARPAPCMWPHCTAGLSAGGSAAEERRAPQPAQPRAQACSIECPDQALCATMHLQRTECSALASVRRVM